MEDAKSTIEQNVDLAHASLAGLYSILDEMEDEFSCDSRYYTMMSCLNDVLAKLDAASDAIEKL